MHNLLATQILNEMQTVSARELHKTLGVKKRFSEWFKINSNGFMENEDYTSVLISTEVENNGGIQIRELQDYNLSLDIAKHICLMSRTEQGKKCRQYLIDLEKAWNTPEQVFARALKLAERKIEELQQNNTVLLEDVNRMKPKEIFADAVATSKTSILVGELAKILKQNGVDIGQNKFFTWLRENGYLINRKGSDWNMPTQKSMNLGLFEIKETVVTHADGHTTVNKTTKVTGKGQQYFINKLLVA